MFIYSSLELCTVVMRLLCIKHFLNNMQRCGRSCRSEMWDARLPLHCDGYDTIRWDRTEESLTWTRKLSIQL